VNLSSSTSPSPSAATTPPAWLNHAAVQLVASILALLALHGIANLLAMPFNWTITAALVFGVVVVRLVPMSPYWLMTLAGVMVLYHWKPRFMFFELPLLALLWALRNHVWAFWSTLVAVGLIAPKTWHRLALNDPQLWNWISESALGHILLVSLLFWFEKRRGRLPDPSYPQWMTLFAGPSNPLNPINLGPLELWRLPSISVVSLARSVLLLGSKGTFIWLMDHKFSGLLAANHSFIELQQAGLATLWFWVGLSYLKLALYLSGSADVAILILRAFGWNLDHPFRWALLAWNPVELWRRWSIYNRKLLLKCFYFPLGGATKRRYINVMVTFWASALVLHTGFIGSVFWMVGEAGLRDQVVYFTLQGFAVCACLALWKKQGKDPSSDKHLRFSTARIAGTVGTQAYSALVHILIMLPNLAWSDRWKLMARCLGLS
jgi:hypothetical protein